MKFLKIYEKFEKKIEINLLDLCEYAGGMYNAIKILKKLSRSSRFEIKFDNYVQFSHFDYDRLETYSDTEKDKEAIKIGKNITLSYGYIRKFPDNNVYFTFCIPFPNITIRW